MCSSIKQLSINQWLSPGNVIRTKENCHFLTQNNGFQVVDGYSALERLKIFSEVKAFVIKSIKSKILRFKQKDIMTPIQNDTEKETKW